MAAWCGDRGREREEEETGRPKFGVGKKKKKTRDPPILPSRRVRIWRGGGGGGKRGPHVREGGRKGEKSEKDA